MGSLWESLCKENEPKNQKAENMHQKNYTTLNYEQIVLHKTEKKKKENIRAFPRHFKEKAERARSAKDLSPYKEVNCCEEPTLTLEFRYQKVTMKKISRKHFLGDT